MCVGEKASTLPTTIMTLSLVDKEALELDEGITV